jgi:hypothetical protein
MASQITSAMNRECSRCLGGGGDAGLTPDADPRFECSQLTAILKNAIAQGHLPATSSRAAVIALPSGVSTSTSPMAFHAVSNSVPSCFT